METTFISILDLSPEARILYSSDSIVDILGYAPEEVVNRSCWDFFHPDEVPLARAKHGRGVELDKAAVLSYCTMRDRNGHWLGCEVVFTVVYDVLVGCTSIYRRGLKSESRAAEAPVVRRMFSTSPRDPRYHMLSHLSSKFSYQPKADAHEPRAALFVNRYTRTLTIMYATNGLSDVLGMSGEEMRGRSFYYCIQENCLPDAVRCLENAKQNDSIAYLRFWFRDPRQDERLEQPGTNTSSPNDTRMDIDDTSSGLRSESEDSEMGGVNLNAHGPRQNTRMPGISESSEESQAIYSSSSSEPTESANRHLQAPESRDSRMSSSGNESTRFTHEAVFGEPPPQYSSASSVSGSPYDERGTGRRGGPIELEAVVSCTSDGLVVCLRRAHPALEMAPVNRPSRPMYENGLFAVPWSPDPVLPPLSQRPQFVQHSESAAGLAGMPAQPQTVQQHVAQPTQPSNADFMNSIRQLSVFAWALNGINGSMDDFSKGTPRGEAQPPAGLPIWQPEAQQQANYEAAGTHTGRLADELSTNPNGANKIVPAPALGTGMAGNSAPPPNFSMPFSKPTNPTNRSEDQSKPTR